MLTRHVRYGVVGVLALGVSLSAAGSVSGTVSFNAKGRALTVTPTFVAYVTGPDDFDATKTVRRLLFSTTDLSKAIQACASLDCADDGLAEGFEVDVVDGPRLNTWFVGNDQRVQYSGTAEPAALTKTTDTLDRLAGSIAIDDLASGGVKAAITFDAPRLKAFTRAR
jgi:hypothetical protein